VCHDPYATWNRKCQKAIRLDIHWRSKDCESSPYQTCLFFIRFDDIPRFFSRQTQCVVTAKSQHHPWGDLANISITEKLFDYNHWLIDKPKRYRSLDLFGTLGYPWMTGSLPTGNNPMDYRRYWSWFVSNRQSESLP